MIVAFTKLPSSIKDANAVAPALVATPGAHEVAPLLDLGHVPAEEIAALDEFLSDAGLPSLVARGHAQRLPFFQASLSL